MSEAIPAVTSAQWAEDAGASLATVLNTINQYTGDLGSTGVWVAAGVVATAVIGKFFPGAGEAIMLILRSVFASKQVRNQQQAKLDGFTLMVRTIETLPANATLAQLKAAFVKVMPEVIEEEVFKLVDTSASKSTVREVSNG